MTFISSGFSEFEAKEIAAVLREVGNRRRLLILLKLIEQGECSLGLLADAAGLSRAALSQHLGRMRDAGLVSCRREKQKRWYRIKDSRVEQLIRTLMKILPSPRLFSVNAVDPNQ
ncbi:ArsR/SmtB family transcription factor [Rhodopseudomonas sp. P2A-2r]|uniref:ArsR/SmtB family transcription factor n=1 Tax=unclassified Rhodopseudomonas TaxID=2638247 RepID=UPI002234DF0E|nr:metalloregulator ArsR/SmtB family transcription factor [Rhodopseudomonas sp. P2A-2r]UZE46915.1 metalloregulator ArsR/SmtB family transcription factor [Rhodopseudomonas sp. P2A-2r]